MSTFEKLAGVLAPLGVYEIKEESTIWSELKAYAVGLDMLREELLELESEAFIPTSESYGLSRRERLFAAVRDDLSVENRRNMLLTRSAFGQGDFTLDGIQKILEFLGIEGSIEEYPFANRVVVWVEDKGLTKGQRNFIISQLNLLFPAHLEIDGVFEGFSWADVKAGNLTFAQMENSQKTWNEIDYLCM